MARRRVRRGCRRDELRMGAHERARGAHAGFLFALAGSLGAVMFSSWRMLDSAFGLARRCARCCPAMRRRSFVGVIETAGGAIYIGLPPALFVWLRDRGAEGPRNHPRALRHHLGRRHLRLFRRQADRRPESRRGTFAEQDLVRHRRRGARWRCCRAMAAALCSTPIQTLHVAWLASAR